MNVNALHERTLFAALFGLLLGMGGGACNSTAPAPSASASASASSPPPSPPPIDTSPIARARTLALAKPAPEGKYQAIDREIEKLQQQYQKIPEKSDTLLLLGQAWVRKARVSADPGFYLNANACADLVLDKKNDDAMALNLKGLVLMNDHRFAEARDLADQMLSKKPNDPMALGTLSDALLELGRFEEAAEAAQKMMDLKPNLPAYSRTSYLRFLRGDIEGAKQAIKLAIEARDPSEPEPGAWAIVQAAVIFWNVGDYSGALAGAEKALVMLPDYPAALALKGRALLSMGKAKEAIEALQKSLDKNPLVETAWVLGDAYVATGDTEGNAQGAFDRAIQIGKQSDRRSLALFLASKNRDIQEALSLAQEEQKVRQDIYTEDALAFALYRAGKLSEAKAAIDKALALGTKDARLFYHAGAIRMAMGNTKEGKEWLERAIALNPQFDFTGRSELDTLLANTKPDKKAGSP